MSSITAQAELSSQQLTLVEKATHKEAKLLWLLSFGPRLCSLSLSFLLSYSCCCCSVSQLQPGFSHANLNDSVVLSDFQLCLTIINVKFFHHYLGIFTLKVLNFWPILKRIFFSFIENCELGFKDLCLFKINASFYVKQLKRMHLRVS